LGPDRCACYSASPARRRARQGRLMTCDVFRTQLASCPHDALHAGLQSRCGLLRRTARARHACGGRRTWVPQAAGMFSSEKAEKEVAAHFAMFNRKGSGASEAGDGQGERAAHSNGRARDRCAARSTLSCTTGARPVLLAVMHALTSSVRRSKHGLPLYAQYTNLPPDGKVRQPLAVALCSSAQWCWLLSWMVV